MKKLYLLLVIGLCGCGLLPGAQAQIIYPYFPQSNVRENLSDVAASVEDPLSFVVDQSKDFTLEVNGTAGVLITIANGQTSYEYSPVTTSKVRFVKKASVVYVYEDAVYKTVINPELQPEFPAIRNETDDKANQKGIYNAANLIANPGFETRTTQGTSTTHYKDGTYWNTYSDAKGVDWGTGTNTSIRSVNGFYSEGSYSLIIHSSSRYLTQNLGKLKPGAYYQISYDYWTSSPAASNGGATYNILLGTTQFGGDVTTLTGHATSLTETSKKTFTGVFKTPETLPDADVWLTFNRPISKVDWMDRVSLLETLSENTARGIIGANGSALYVAGVAYAPEIQLNEDDYVEMTQFIANPSFETSFTGWTNSGMATQTNTSFGAYKNGTTYVEKWVSAAPLPDVSITQSLTGLPKGRYILKAAAHHILQNPLSGKPGGFIFANDAQTEVAERNDYAVDFLVVDGTALIGFKTVGSQANWAAIDNFRLEYKGLSVNLMKANLQKLKDSASVLLGNKMQNPIRAELLTAIDSAQLGLSDPQIGELVAELISGMQDAIRDANESIAAYSELQNAIDDATVVYGDGSGKKAQVLHTIIQENQTLANNLDASFEELKNGVSKISSAVFEFRLANSTGTAPVVVTNPNFARGATMAFGRSSISGTPVADLLEHGFCWSTNPEPTIFDDKTSKYFSQNGFIYRMENLQPSTVYYMRAYAISKSYAVGYGDVIKVITIPKGTVTYQLNSSVVNSGANYPRIASAMASAVDYFNNLTSIKGHRLSVNYNSGTPTAEASYGGYMQFGANSSYQRTGTALHEMGHTIGVGQHSIWYGPNSPLRANGTRGIWLGERASKVVQFLENNTTGSMTGDAVHMWPYGINGAHEDTGSELLYIANALIHQALGEDGLPPTGGFATPAYTFNQNDTTKYYIKIQDEALGRKSTFLVEDASGQLVNKMITHGTALATDSAAWYFKFDPATGYYRIRNAATGKYFTYQASGVNGITLTSVLTPSASNNFQLMGARYNTQIGDINGGITVKPYSIVRPEARLTPPALAANANGSVSAVAFNNRNEASTQHWLLLSAQEVNALGTLPAFVNAQVDIITSTGSAGCDTLLNYSVGVTGNPAPALTYTFAGATTGSGEGTGSGSVFNKGTTTVTIAATNSLGSTIHNFKITVRDSIDPVIIAPQALVVGTDDACTATNVSLGQPLISDNCSSADSLVLSNNAPAIFPIGTTTVTWKVTDAAGNSQTAAQAVTVTDHEKPVLTAPAAKSLCYSENGYTIPQLTAKDNCGIASVSYSITGETSRTGAGTDASGSFDVGVSTITWTVTDLHNNQATASTTVIVNAPLAVSIPDVYAVSQEAGDRNTLYTGYGPASLTLSAVPKGGAASYSYTWSTGQASPSIDVSTGGTYTVTITDAAGCTATASISIHVIDVTCGNNGDKVMVCHNGKAICVASASVKDHLDHGDSLGACTTSPAALTMTAALANPVALDEPLMSIYPNPSKGQITVQLSSSKAGKTTVLVVDMNGRVVAQKEVMSATNAQVLTLDISDQVQGVYMVKIVGVDGTKTQKVILQQ